MKTDEDKKSTRSFQKAEETIDGIYSGLFNMPLKPVANEEFTGEVKEVYERLQPFAEKYSDLEKDFSYNQSFYSCGDLCRTNVNEDVGKLQLFRKI